MSDSSTSKCPHCNAQDSLLPLADTNQKKVFVRFSVQSKETASAGNLIIGGPGFVASCKICNKCLFIAWFFEPQLDQKKEDK